MKRAFFLLVVGVGVLGVGLLVGWQAADVLTRFKIDREDARQALASAYKNGYFSPPNAADDLLRAVPEGERTGVVQALGKVTRAVVSEPAFLDLVMGAAPDYEQERGRWAHEMLAEYDQELVRMDESLKSCAKAPTAEDRKLCEEGAREGIKSIKQMRDELAADTASHNRGVRSQIKQMRDMRAQQRKELATAHRAKLIERLQGFVTMAKTVDFNAQLGPCRYGKKQCFVNPAYENKGADWKRCYRAGRTYTTAAIAYAEQWLAELKAGR